MQRLLLGCLALLLGLLGGATAYAQDERATVRLDGRAVLRVGPAPDVDATERAARIEQRINTLLQTPEAITPARIEVSTADPTARIISVSGVPIVTVTETDAEDNLTDIDLLARQWTQALDASLLLAVERRQAPGGRFVAEVRGAIENAFAGLAESLITIIPRALAALLVIALFWLFARTTRWLAEVLFCRFTPDPTVQNLVKQVGYYTIWVLGIIVAVDAFGMDPQTLVAGLGLTGIALGFALRDIISNFVSGLLILTLRPFNIGDQIIVGETEGSVERIELRATQMRTYDGRQVLVPNADVFTSRVTNNTASPMRRGEVQVHIGYDANLETAATLARSIAQRTTGVLEEPPVVVLASALGPEAITLELRFWADSRRIDFVATQSAVRRAIVAGFKEQGISLPEPNVRVMRQSDERRWNVGRETLTRDT